MKNQRTQRVLNLSRQKTNSVWLHKQSIFFISTCLVIEKHPKTEQLYKTGKRQRVSEWVSWWFNSRPSLHLSTVQDTGFSHRQIKSKLNKIKFQFVDHFIAEKSFSFFNILVSLYFISVNLWNVLLQVYNPYVLYNKYWVREILRR